VTEHDGTWFDDAAGPLVRPYAMTGGRTSSRQTNLELITLVVALRPVSRSIAASLEPECVQILFKCQQPRSIAEMAAELGLPLSVVKILIGDLIDKQLVMFRSAVTPDVQVLQAVINGIRRI
jgi:Protein of unknown function (DUF742)